MHLDCNNSNLEGAKLCQLIQQLRVHVVYCSEFIFTVCWCKSRACFKSTNLIIKIFSYSCAFV